MGDRISNFRYRGTLPASVPDEGPNARLTGGAVVCGGCTVGKDAVGGRHMMDLDISYEIALVVATENLELPFEIVASRICDLEAVARGLTLPSFTPILQWMVTSVSIAYRKSNHGSTSGAVHWSVS